MLKVGLLSLLQIVLDFPKTNNSIFMNESFKINKSFY